MDTSGYELSDLDEIDFLWKNPQLKLNSAMRPRIDFPYFPLAFDSLELGESVENPILLVNEEEKEKNRHPQIATLKTQSTPCLAAKSNFEKKNWN